MLFDAKQAIGFQQVAHPLQLDIGNVPAVHIVQHAHQDDPVETALFAFGHGVERKGGIVGGGTTRDFGDIIGKFCSACLYPFMRGRIAEACIAAEKQADEFALFIHIAAKGARHPFAAGGIFADLMVRMDAEKFEGFCRVTIFVTLCILGARRVGKDFGHTIFMRLVHGVMCGLFSLGLAMMVGGNRGNQ